MLFNSVLKKLKNRGVGVYAFIHDLEILRIGKSKRYYKKFEDACSRFDSSEAERISLLSFKCYETGYIRKRSYYDSTELMPFEFIEIPVPSGYDSILTTQYGNYEEIVKGNTWHGKVIFDTKTPYDKLLTQYRW